jgi:ATP-dependent DNA helicase RecQ
VVAAGPGSGKTKLLTHKLASLYMMEDVKHEQMLMLTFSRAAATEFKKRLMTLIGNAANFIQITTFHSHCFDLLGKVGDIEKSDDVIERTVERINAGEVDLTRLTKTVLVIDEAQDMSGAEYALVRKLIEVNNDLRVIAVGDDDQNIYGFRGSDSSYFESLLDGPGARKYELVENYRSGANIVEFANRFAGGISRRFKSTPIMPVKKEDGIVSVRKLSSDNFAIPTVEALLDIKPSGSVCIIVRTNNEALNIVGLLTRSGISARKIQTNDGFNLLNLVELKDFLSDIGADDDGYAISDEVWQRAKRNSDKKYLSSGNLQSVRKLIRDFEETNNKTKYKSDFQQFVRESRLEDFTAESEGTVLVSTIHQTKGREFDSVFLAFSRFFTLNDEARREIYVALTRAKRNLYVLYNGDYFDGINLKDMIRSSDNVSHPPPAQINLQLSHRDVALGFFEFHRKEIDSLTSGGAVSVGDTGCFIGERQVLKFSGKFRGELESLKGKGYSPSKATVRHVLFWRDKDGGKEIKMFLPEVEFTNIPRNGTIR